ncbi:MAG: hypothetical protein ACOCU0_00075 [Bacillota bacterium]
MMERKEWMKQFMKDLDEKMDAKFERKVKKNGHPLHPVNNDHEVSVHEDDTTSSSYQVKQARTLKILVNSCDGDKVRINVPLSMGRMILKKGSKLSRKWNDALDEQDTDMILNMVEQGQIGEILNVESANGDTVIIRVE